MNICIGGSTYKVGDCIVYPFITFSPIGGITRDILIKYLQHIDDHINYDCTITNTTIFLDGHGSRFENGRVMGKIDSVVRLSIWDSFMASQGYKEWKWAI